MSHKTVTISLIGLAALMISCTFVFSHQPVSTNDSNNTKTYDAFVEQLHQTQFSKTGARDTVFMAPKIKHYAHDGHSQIAQPHIVLHNNKGIWDVTADQATTLADNNEIQLTGHVKIIQPATQSSPQTTITTDAALVYPKRSYAITEDYVTIHRANTMIAGQGATADMKKGIIKLLAHTRGHYVPAQTT